MEKELEELIRNRKELIEAHRKNNFTDGIHALLTDLYPDTAHFIYELLQNAEDMNATEVRFHLYEDRVDFEHNGTKRTFNIHDIDAITNIGHNAQKKDDPTSIGKFGVGFKAVFAYTSTPEIHSGDYHFRIRDYFVPDFDDVEHVSVIDKDGISWTIFRFPFNNPAKPSKIAYKEVFNGLRELNGDSILFLQNIELIEYQINDGDIRTVKKENREEHIYRVTYYNDEQDVNYYSDWLCFTKQVEISDDKNNLKSLPIAVAYHLDYDDEIIKYTITPAFKTGKTFIYFPAEKENSGLRFYINAPFASTVARDSIRNCPENYNLINNLANLVSDSLFYIKEKGWLNYDFLSVLPNNNDDLGMFGDIRSHIFGAFKEKKLLPYNENTYVCAYDAIICDYELSELFPNKEEFASITGIDKYLYVLPEEQRAQVFVQNVVGNNFTNMEFEKLIVYNPPRLSAIIKTRSEKWLLDFYKRILTNFETYKYGKGWCDCPKYNHFKDMLKNISLIRGNDNKYYKPDELFILSNGVNLINKDTAIIKPSLLSDNNAKELFKILDVKEYGPDVIVKSILEKYIWLDTKIDVGNHINDLLTFARYDSQKYGEIIFSDYYLFKVNENSFFKKAEYIFLGEAYGKPDGELLARVLDESTLWNGYKEHCTEKELKELITFAERCGAKKGLKVIKTDASKNPKYNFLTSCFSGKRITSNKTSVDYTIPRLKELLELKSIDINRIIWNTFWNLPNTANFTEAKYSPNDSYNCKKCDSMLVYLLKNNAWIPDNNGVLHKPEDICENDINSSFDFDPEDICRYFGSLLYHIDIGKKKNQNKKERADAEKYADANGCSIIDKDRLKELEEKEKELESIHEKKQRRKKYRISSVNEAFKHQTKKQKFSENNGDDFLGSGVVNNKNRREKKYYKSFR